MAVSNLFTAMAWSEGLSSKAYKELTRSKLQKLTFLSHAYYLGFSGYPMVKDSVRAGEIGPYFIRLIEADASIKNGKKLCLRKHRLDNYSILDLDALPMESSRIIAFLWKFLKDDSERVLISATKRKEGSWYRKTNGYIPNDRIVYIPNELTHDCYASIIDKGSKT